MKSAHLWELTETCHGICTLVIPKITADLYIAAAILNIITNLCNGYIINYNPVTYYD